jgi:hypothetical protein
LIPSLTVKASPRVGALCRRIVRDDSRFDAVCQLIATGNSDFDAGSLLACRERKRFDGIVLRVLLPSAVYFDNEDCNCPSDLGERRARSQVVLFLTP